MTNRDYDFLKRLVVVLSLIMSGYYIAYRLGIYKMNVDSFGIYVLVFTALNLVLYFLSKRYHHGPLHYAGDLEIEELEPGVKTFSLSLESDPHDLEKYDLIVFKVKTRS